VICFVALVGCMSAANIESDAFLASECFSPGGFGFSVVYLKCLCCMTMAVRFLVIRRIVCYYWEAVAGVQCVA